MNIKKIIKILTITVVFVIILLITIIIFKKRLGTQQTPSVSNFNLNFRDFFPFGGNTNLTPPIQTVNQGGDNETETEAPTITPKLRQISFFDTSGAKIIETSKNQMNNDGEIEIVKEKIIQFVEKTNGYVYQTKLKENELAKKISSTLLPRINEAKWNTKGDNIVFRFLRETDNSIATFLGKTPKTNEQGGDSILEIEGIFFPDNILEFDISPDGTKIFYLTKKESGGSMGTISLLNQNQKNIVFDSGLKEWLVDWISDEKIILSTKPSYIANGYTYSINPTTRSISKITGDKKGLTTLYHPKDNYIFESFIENREIVSFIENTETKERVKLTAGTIADKCTWGNDYFIYCGIPKNTIRGEFPDVWYQGLFSFNDSIWKIDRRNGQMTLIIDFSEESGFVFDVTKIEVDEFDNYLIFINKINGELWGVRLD